VCCYRWGLHRVKEKGGSGEKLGSWGGQSRDGKRGGGE